MKLLQLFSGNLPAMFLLFVANRKSKYNNDFSYSEASIFNAPIFHTDFEIEFRTPFWFIRLKFFSRVLVFALFLPVF